jgi:peroxiredoxin
MGPMGRFWGDPRNNRKGRRATGPVAYKVWGVCRNEANAFSKKLENFKDAGSVVLGLLQLREVQHRDSRHASNGRWRYKHVLDSPRSRGED